jgi:SecD/SecF fusion protein
VIRSFTVAMLFGVVVGTFSSIYIAAPVLILFKLRPENFREDVEGKGEGQTDQPNPAA